MKSGKMQKSATISNLSKPQRYFSFADLAIENHADKNRAMAMLNRDLCRTIPSPADPCLPIIGSVFSF
jgi:hypothetical protein